MIPVLLSRSAARWGLAVILMCAGTAGIAQAGDYDFKLILDTSGPLKDIPFAPDLNNHGTIAFYAETAEGVPGVFTTDGTSLNAIAMLKDAVPGIGPIGFVGFEPALNDSGEVALWVSGSFPGNPAIVKGRGGPNRSLTPIAVRTIPGLYSNLGDCPAINNNGDVLFRAQPAGWGYDYYLDWVLYRGNGTDPVVTIASSQGLSNEFSRIDSNMPAENNNGAVVFTGWRRDFTGGSSQYGVYVFDGTANRPAYVPADHIHTFLTTAPDINDKGQVVFYMWSSDQPLEDIYVTTVGGTATKVVEGDIIDPYTTVGINNNGTIAFCGQVGGVAGLFTGGDPIADRVISAGDPLGGSTVVSLAIERNGLNDLGQMAFRATLADGRAGLFLATPVVRPLPVAIDVKPGDAANRITLDKDKQVQVAILSGATFDASTVNLSSVRFGRTGTEDSLVRNKRGIITFSLADANGDGRLDLIASAVVAQTGFQPGDTVARLTGTIRDGRELSGSDTIVVVTSRRR